MTELMGLLSSLAVPGSAVGAAVIGIISLMRLRSTDREALSTSQRAYIDQLVKARDEADARAVRYRDEIDEERVLRLEAESRKLISEGHAQALQVRVEALEYRLQQSQPNREAHE